MPEYLNEKIWRSSIALAKSIGVFKDFTYFLQENKNDVWRKIFEEDDPFNIPLPDDCNKLSNF